MRRFLTYLGIGFFSLAGALWIASGYIGTRSVTAPHHHAIGARAELAGRPVQDVTIKTDDGITLSAWYVPNDGASGTGDTAIITLCGITEDRNQLASAAEVYVRWGLAALLPDLRGTGQSGGDTVSIGYYERKDLAACVRWLHEKGYQRVGAHGFSLGAATICFAFKDIPNLGFAIVESSYDTMKNAIDHRLDIYHVPRFVGWPYQFFFSWTMGASFRTMSPIEYVGYCKCPALFLGGDNEVFLTADETTQLFNRCGSGHKRFHIFAGGHHAPSINRFPDEARNTIRQFLVEEAGCTLR